MRKHEFINELTRALSQVDPQTQREIIADINEHFAEGASQGLSEEEICRNLGQPSQIAEQVLEELKSSGGQRSYNHYQDSGNLFESIGDLVGNVGDFVSSIVGDIGNNNDFDTFSKIDDYPDDFSNFNETTRVRGGYEINIEETIADVRSLDVDLSCCELMIRPAPQGEMARVAIKGRSRYDNFQIENRNGRLFIAQKHPKFRFEILSFRTKIKAMVYLPANFNGEIKVRVSAGNIKLANLCGNLDLNASAGSITIDMHRGEYARLRSSAGGIRLAHCGIIDIDAKSSAGAVSVEGQGVGNLNLDSSAGEINVRVIKLGGETKLSSSAGTIKLEAQEVMGNITARASAGGITMRLPRDVNCRIDVKKPSLGVFENYLMGNPNSPYVIRASASVGSIRFEALD
ncbi:MAG: DUF4097 family beta strand repeat-containing protein [Defluviitaleaceae bacterium]|nr:DUF4097 family beta strand repeat-containing protein [Defluviitaleaceae bacterium]